MDPPVTDNKTKRTGNKKYKLDDCAPYVCPVCNRAYLQRSGLRRHLKRTHPGGDYIAVNPAQISPATIIPSVETANAKESAGKEKVYPCNTCGRKYQSSRSLRRHEKQHLGIMYSCHICGRNFTEPTNMRRHITTHMKEYTCDLCGERFAQMIEFAAHQLKHTSGELGDVHYKCRQCDEQFPDAESRRVHEAGHPPQRREHHCDICGKDFLHLESLERHQIIHPKSTSSKNKYKCEVCEKEFIHSETLARHSTVHPELADNNNSVHRHKRYNKRSCSPCGSNHDCNTKGKRNGISSKMTIKEEDQIGILENNDYKESHHEINQDNPLEFIKKRIVEVDQRRHKIIGRIGDVNVKCDEEDDKCNTLQGDISRYTNSKQSNLPSGPHTLIISPEDNDDNIQVNKVVLNPTKINHRGPFSIMSPLKKQLLNFNQAKSVETLIQCGICGKNYASYEHRKIHYRLHSCSDQHICPVCDKRFCYVLNLQRHLQMHVRDKNDSVNEDDEEEEYLSEGEEKELIEFEEKYIQAEKERQIRATMKTMLNKEQLSLALVETVASKLSDKYASQKIEENGSTMTCDDVIKNAGGNLSSYNADDNNVISKEMITESKIKSEDGCSDENVDVVGSVYLDSDISVDGNEERDMKCAVCGREFTNKEEYSQHIEDHSNENNVKNDYHYKCKLCKKQFSSFDLLKSHNKVKHNKKCGSDIKNEQIDNNISDIINELDDNEKNGEAEIPTGVLAKKMYVTFKNGKKQFNCQICHRKYTKSSSLYRHIRKHLGIRKHSCPTCDKRFNEIGSLKKHMLVHSGEKPFKCEMCNKQFTYQSNLNAHMRQHIKEKEYKCNICCKPFATDIQLRRHMQTHSDNRPYVCETCGKGFLNAYSLKQHKKSHRVHPCKNCNKIFSKPFELTRHIKTEHLSLIECPLCSKIFSSIQYMRAHLLVHSENPNHKCFKCCQSFDTFALLQDHILKKQCIPTQDDDVVNNDALLNNDLPDITAPKIDDSVVSNHLTDLSYLDDVNISTPGSLIIDTQNSDTDIVATPDASTAELPVSEQTLTPIFPTPCDKS